MIDIRRAGYNIELSAPLDNIPFSTSSERERIEENVCGCLIHSKTSIYTFRINDAIHFKYCCFFSVNVVMFCSDKLRQIFRNKMDFFAAAKVSSSFPPPDLPEIAFAGRVLNHRHFIFISLFLGFLGLL